MSTRKPAVAGSVARRSGRATVLAWVLPHLLTHVAAAGHDATPIRRLPGLRGRDLDDPDVCVADSAASEAWGLAERITGDDNLGLHMALALPAGALDLVEYAFRSSATLESGLEQLARYARVISDRAAPEISLDAVALTVSFATPPERTGRRQRVEFALALLVRFDQPTNRLLFARADATRALRSSDPALLGVVRRRLDKMLAQVAPEDESAAAGVRRVLLESLARGEPSAAAVARELGLSERTLQRRLRGEGA